MDINQILKTLPHRFPFLLIDRVINIREDYSGIGVKNVTLQRAGVSRAIFPIARSFPAC